jgi:ABC-type Zn uptake system ZnuABC Zn-binding protein ZnuA
MRAYRVFPVAMLLAVLLPGDLTAGAADKPLVLAATIFPAVDIVRRVAGPDVRVIQVLPAGASPHTFDLTPARIRELQAVRVIFKIGGIDDWIDGVGESLPRAAVVALHKGIVRRPFHGHGHGHDHGSPQHGEDFDPHYWLNAENGMIMARNVAAALAALDPGRAAVYEENRRGYSRELARLHDELKTVLSGLKQNRMIVFHDAWRYFAAAYGLEIAAVFQASPGQEPTPRSLQKIYELAETSGTRVIFSEPQLPATSIEPLRRDLGLRLVVLDPLGGAAPGDSYAGMLRRIARAVRLALER